MHLLSSGPAKSGKLSAESVTGCSLKKGESDPAIKEDSEYPAWLFELMKPEATVAELERLYHSEGLNLAQVGTNVLSSDLAILHCVPLLDIWGVMRTLSSILIFRVLPCAS